MTTTAPPPPRRPKPYQLQYYFLVAVTVWIVLLSVTNLHFLPDISEQNPEQSSLYVVHNNKKDDGRQATSNPQPVLRVSKSLPKETRKDPEKIQLKNFQKTITTTTANSTINCQAKHSFQDILHCVPENGRVKLNGTCATRIETWNDVQHCINAPRRHMKSTATNSRTKGTRTQIKVHLIGERNSGTKFLVQEMQECFQEMGIKIQRDLFNRNKHFFQDTNRFSSYQQSHIVVAIFREPLEWVGAMIEKPYHMTEHQQGFDEQGVPIPLAWQDFVSKQWTMKNRSKYDYKLLAQWKQNPRKFLPCRTGMDFHQVMPCRFDPGTIPDKVVREQNPVYELKRGGAYNDEPYANILELRSDKIINFLLEVPLLQDLGGYLAVRFEDLLQNGTRSTLQEVARMIGMDELPISCKPQGPKPEMLGRRKIPDGLKAWVKEHLILHTEKLLGYR
jgi:hypothetical protein